MGDILDYSFKKTSTTLHCTPMAMRGSPVVPTSPQWSSSQSGGSRRQSPTSTSSANHTGSLGQRTDFLDQRRFLLEILRLSGLHSIMDSGSTRQTPTIDWSNSAAKVEAATISPVTLTSTLAKSDAQPFWPAVGASVVELPLTSLMASSSPTAASFLQSLTSAIDEPPSAMSSLPLTPPPPPMAESVAGKFLPPTPPSHLAANLDFSNVWASPPMKRRRRSTPSMENVGQSLVVKQKFTPDDKKDDAYWERRRKNNDAAKRSRDSRRLKEEEVAVRATFLEQENLKLRAQVNVLKAEISKLHFLLFSNGQQQTHKASS